MFIRKYSQGFGMVEVLIALLVLGFGIAGAAKLQGVFYAAGDDAQTQTIASSLAQKKLDDLKSFTEIDTPVDANGDDISWAADADLTMVFDYIEDDQGGIIASGTQGDLDNSNTTYSLTWTSEDHWYEDTDADGDAETDWDAAGYVAAGEAVPDSMPDYKMVTVTVAWQDRSGANRSIQLAGNISSTPAGGTANLAAGSGGNSNEDPIVYHTPGLAPDVIPICESGTCMEADKPEPDVSANDKYLEVEFSNVTYDSDNGGIALESESFITVNCACTQLGVVDGKLSLDPTTRSLNSDGDELIDYLAGVSGDAEQVLKRTGERISTGQDGQQSIYCNDCCRDHHDREGAPAVYDPFRPSSDYLENGDHHHYYDNNNNGLIEEGEYADDVNDIYLESCRLKQVDGVFRVLQDWNMETLKVLPASYLQGSDVSDYQSYVMNFVQDYVNAIDNAYPATTPTPSTVFSNDNEPDNLVIAPNDTDTLIARGVFIDYMDADVIRAVKKAIANNNVSTALALTPFYEVNVTQLATWSSSSSSEATVTSEPVVTANAHDRGTVTAITGTPDIAAAIGSSNSGLTDSGSIDPNDANIVSDDITLDIGGVPPTTGPVVSGSILLGSNSNVGLSDSVVTGIYGAICSTELTGHGNNVQRSFECTLSIEGYGGIRISNYTQEVTIGNGNNAVTSVQNNKVCASVTPYVTNDGLEVEYSEIYYFFDEGLETISGQNILIKEQNETC